MIDAFLTAATGPEVDLATAALLIARIEHPQFDPAPYLRRLDDIGIGAKQHVAACCGTAAPANRAWVDALNTYLFGEMGFTGNTRDFDDPRNSFLHEVLDRQVGIPVTLSVLYIEVARRAGMVVHGLNFPGYFLVHPVLASGERDCDRIVIDPFHGGIALSVQDCKRLMPEGLGDDRLVERTLVSPATTQEILIRMLHNLKRIYVRMRSFPQARTVADMLIGLDPTCAIELRDRGLLAYHLNDFQAALRDLEKYLSSSGPAELDETAREEHERVWEHVKVLRRRVADMN